MKPDLVPAQPDRFAYVGGELELFAAAGRWKRYCYQQLQPFLGPAVLEVGAGIGATTRALCRQSHARWVCLEPDAGLAAVIEDLVRGGSLPAFCEVRIASLASIPAESFDSILYIDVLEHIRGDRAELAHAAQLLSPGGYLVVLSPAYQSLYSEFDAAIGHFRRYTTTSLARAAPADLMPVRLRYLDSAGALTSWANRVWLHQSTPTAAQIAFWDRWLVPISRRLDPLIRYRVGRSVLAIWRRPAVRT